ncbi:MAG TPA: hypothetical protein VFN67_20650 [Polyangiales bacterium]|nr:hypothetical protein [Polyangiales bacterium]
MGLARCGSSVVSRSRQRPLRVAVLCALLWLAPLACRAGSADVSPRDAELVVDADASCIRADVLRERVTANAWRWVEGSPEQAELRLAATVRPVSDTGSGLEVTLQLHRPDGRTAERTLAAQSCEAALDALALLIQMTLDAESRSPELALGERESWSRVSQLALGVSVGVGAAAAPALQPGLAAYAAVDLQGFGLTRPRLQLELSHAWRSGIVATGGKADFALTGGQLLVCPVGVRAATLAAHGCGTLELAWLSAQGRDAYEPRAQAHAWASAGLAVLMQVRPVPKLELQLGAGLARPLWRDQFSFAPNVFYAVPAWRWQIKLGLAVCFL